MNYIEKWYYKLTEITPEFVINIIKSILIIVIFGFLIKIIDKLIMKKYDNVQSRYKTKKIFHYVFMAFSVLIIGAIWFEEFQSLTTFLGLFSAGIAIALKDLLTDVAGWIFIVWRKPFQVGDRIQISHHAGDVIDLRIFQFTLLEIGNWVDGDQSTGRIVHIPNGKLFSESLANYSRGFKYIWNEIPVVVTFESDWKKAKEILLEIVNKNTEHLSGEAEKRVKEASRKFMIFYTKLTPTVYTSAGDSGVILTMRYLCNPRNRRNTIQDIWEDVLEEFSRHDDIDLAYPTHRVYNNKVEGKKHTTSNNIN